MGNWQLDPYHTQVEFSAKHLGMMTVRGHFAELSAVADIDPANPEAASVEVTISAASIRTHHEARDNDLRSENFLDVASHPEIKFRGTSVKTISPDDFDLNGELTVKGITHPITLRVTRYGEFNDPMMGHRIAYSATGKLNRKDYGLSFNMMLDGKFVVSDEIGVFIEGELVEQQQTPDAATS